MEDFKKDKDKMASTMTKSAMSTIGRLRNWRIGLFIRELLGWGLLVLGLNVFRISFQYLDSRQVVEAAIATLIGFFVFRGGLQLLKVALAARSLASP